MKAVSRFALRRAAELDAFEQPQRWLVESLWADQAVGIVGDAFWPGQRVTITTLQDLEQEAESVDMVTIVVVGNSTTYVHSEKIITPRGYEEKGQKS